MKKAKFLCGVLLVSVLISCGTTSTVPVTGRKQHISVSDEQILSLSQQEYTKYMASAKKSTNAKNTAMVQRVGKRLATAVESYLRNNGYESELKNYNWEFNLVQDQSANAFCMPGGKIVVYEGLLPYTQNETALAIVLGHEIAHAVAKHSQEQLSKQQNQQVGAQILGGVLNAAGVGSNVSDIAQIGFGLGSKFSNLHYSRSNESEADHMGLIFAAMAGYDPKEAVTFWQRMSASTQSSMPEFLSDHPSGAKRVEESQDWMPGAETYCKAATGNNKTTKERTSEKTTSSKRKKK